MKKLMNFYEEFLKCYAQLNIYLYLIFQMKKR